MQSHYIGRQPIIDNQGSVLAYDLVYEDGEAGATSNRALASTLISTVLNTVGVKSVLGERMGFVRIDHKFLLSDLMLSAPKEFFVFSLLDTTIIDEKLVERMKELRGQGYWFALDDITRHTGPLQRFSPILPYLNFFKIDIRYFPEQYLAKLKKILSEFPLEVVITHVENDDQYAICRSLRFPYLEGYYFAEPNIIENKSFDPKTFVVIQLYNQLMSDESTLDQLVQTFETNHDLTIQLLQYINSKAFSLANNVSNVKQVLALLGRQPLAQWLMLLIYGKSISTSKYQEPLLLMVKNRTELMSGLLKLVRPGADKTMQGEAYFIGVMSLSSVVLGMPLRLILKEMHISDEVREALLEKAGLLGEMLSAVKAIEKFDTEVIDAYAAAHQLSRNAIQELMTRTMEIVTGFEAGMPKNF
ncbi:MAG: EAL domain-containing protein [Campylobacterota bacterium]|nr:EAL domain-containing protein [Campylobacterota bacterium]